MKRDKNTWLWSAAAALMLAGVLACGNVAEAQNVPGARQADRHNPFSSRYVDMQPNGVARRGNTGTVTTYRVGNYYSPYGYGVPYGYGYPYSYNYNYNYSPYGYNYNYQYAPIYVPPGTMYGPGAMQRFLRGY